MKRSYDYEVKGLGNFVLLGGGVILVSLELGWLTGIGLGFLFLFLKDP